ncbi:MAG TPA: hypothetical protein VHB47_10470 [Thermoanaerobaculia bacterium]|jgi:hypothetical protein|nr:hypothetical protein [Thermoanaerobaculia bacterium]
MPAPAPHSSAGVSSSAASWNWWAALPLLAAGVALRVATAFPSHKYPADADCVEIGLAGLRLLHGHPPVFFASSRVGALGAYPAGLLFLLFGASRATLAAGPMIVQILLLAAWTLFLRELLGARLALWGLPFAALPPAAVNVWTYMPNGYPEVLLVCATTLWLAARLARIARPPSAPAPDVGPVRTGGRGGWPTCFALGMSLGVGWWASAQTLVCSGPALAWLAWRRPRLAARRRFWSLTALGAVLGALPWIVFNFRYSFPSLLDNFGLRPVAGLAAALDNARYLVRVNLPQLLASTDGFDGSLPRNPAQRLLHLPVLLISVGLSLFAILAIPRLWRHAAAQGGRAAEPAATDPAAAQPEAAEPAAAEPEDGATAAVERAALPLCVLVIAASAGVYLVSFAGSVRALPVRYVMPIYLVVPVLFALSLHRLARRSPALAAALAAAVLAFNLASTLWPWTAKRQQWAADAVEDRRALRLLEQRQVTAVIGPYWLIYPLNFLSGERILAIPIDAATDFRHEIERLPPAPVRWALVSGRAEDLAPWARAAGVTGEPCRLGSSFGLLLPRYDVPPRRLRELLAIAWWKRSTGEPGGGGTETRQR